MHGTSSNGFKSNENGKGIDELLDTVNTPEGRARALRGINAAGGNRYGADEKNHPGKIIEYAPDGTVRVGRFSNRKFLPDNT